ncbi:hypothetical protein N0B31_00350 [Salinirubellus salinus]|uniref:Uncharacterized protein n=1 Tax=Salinirubellus salinus TaxID=1364945 RepID=A0A9E7R395_9EURY|nr:hypothetical protein [Salinirubellus salinus]UWM54676.1 hypothetical protein N0B31_21480 [Salinirubellus salinus]UWM54746.1 hypothetical protein N0B31_00350 [Salinirubellus salinus]
MAATVRTATETTGGRTLGGFGYRAETMTTAHWVVAGLAAVTGGIHAYLYLTQGFLPFGFAAVVFFAAVLGLLLNVYRRALYALGIPFTLGQVAMWYLQGMPDFTLGVVDKAVQLALVAMLVYLLLNERRLVARSR